MSEFIEINAKDLGKKTLSQLCEYCNKYEINPKKISEKSGKEINKSKKEIIDELLNLKNDNEKKTIKEENNLDNTDNLDKDNLDNTDDVNKYQEGCTRILVYAENFKNKFKKADEDTKKHIMSQEYIEKTFDVKFEFGSFIYFGDYYIINHQNKLVLCDEWCPEQSMDDNIYINIPYEICQKLTCAPTFFGLIGNEHNQKCRKIKTNFECHFDDKIMISELTLDHKDKHIEKKFGKINDNKGILFKFYWNEYVCEYQDNKVLIPYLVNDKPLGLDKGNSFVEITLKKDITFERILEYQQYISTFKYKYPFFKSGPIDNDEDPIWSDNIEVVDVNKEIKDGDLNYSCNIICTEYDKYLNLKNVKEQFDSRLKSKDKDHQVYINWSIISKKKTSIDEEQNFSDLINEDDYY